MLAVAFAAVALAAPVVASAATPGWTDATTLANSLEDDGVTISSHRAVDSALCNGVRRYGHRAFGVGIGYHRFKCSIDTADGHAWSTSVAITRSVVGAKPGSDEPARLTARMAAAERALAAAEKRVQPVGTLTENDRKQIAEYLQKYKEAVAVSAALVEPYRTRFTITLVDPRQVG